PQRRGVFQQLRQLSLFRGRQMLTPLDDQKTILVHIFGPLPQPLLTPPRLRALLGPTTPSLPPPTTTPLHFPPQTTHGVQNQLVDVLLHMENTQLMLRFWPDDRQQRR